MTALFIPYSNLDPECGDLTGIHYSLISVFNITDADNKNLWCLLIRNPLGNEPNYDADFSSTSSRWTDSLVAQVPFGIDPRKSDLSDGIFVVPIELFKSCFVDF